MKNAVFAILFSFIFSFVQSQDYLNVMTFNVRYNNAGDSLNAWPYRQDKVAGQILFHEAHIMGVQEALDEQMVYLQGQLTRFRYVGVGREDGFKKGEYSAIFIDTTRLRIMTSSTFWLAEDPSSPGAKGWDAAITRIVTWAKLQDRKTRKVFFVFNTHFDHIGKQARRESARLVLKKVHEIAAKSPAVITGDFNAKPTDEPIQILVDKNDPLHLIDSKELSAMPHYGPTGTFNGFRSKEMDDLPIDHIFIKNGVKVLQHATLSQSWQGRFSSDHFPVFARVVIQ